MKVAELIALLQKQPQDANVTFTYDGFVKDTVRHVWLARSESVVMDDGCGVFETKNRPAHAPDDNDYDGTWWPGIQI